MPWRVSSRSTPSIRSAYARRSLNSRQQGGSAHQRTQALAKGEADELAAVFGLGKKTAARHHGQADVAHQMMGKGDVVGIAEVFDAGHDIESAGRRMGTKPGPGKSPEQVVATCSVLGEHSGVVVI